MVGCLRKGAKKVTKTICAAMASECLTSARAPTVNPDARKRRAKVWLRLLVRAAPAGGARENRNLQRQ